MKSDITQDARRHMRRALYAGITDKAGMTEHAMQALLTEGHTQQAAHAATEVAWAQFFAIFDPI
jgi:hypothetical protein